MRCEEAVELSAAYALGALDERETEQLERHLEGCPACRLTLEQDRDIVGRLAHAVKPAEPPASLKTRLLSQVEAYERAAPAAASTREPRRLLSFLTSHRFAFASTAIAVMVGLTAWSVTQTVRLNEMRNDYKTTASRLNEIESNSVQVSTNLQSIETDNVQLASVVKRQWDALAFATAPDTWSIRLTSADGSATATASLFMDNETNRAMMMVTGLNPPQASQTYQLWCITSDQRIISLGTFRTVGDGYAAWPFQYPYSASVAKFLNYIVSVEPTGGSSWPTTSAVLRSRTQ